MTFKAYYFLGFLFYNLTFKEHDIGLMLTITHPQSSVYRRKKGLSDEITIREQRLS